MGYAVPEANQKCFQYDTTNLIVSSDSETHTASDTYVLAKELKLRIKIYPYSVFYYTFQLKSSIPASDAKAQLVINDNVINTYTENGGYALQTEKVEGEYYNPNITKVQLYIRDAAGGANQAYVKEFRVYALETPFEITQESV